MSTRWTAMELDFLRRVYRFARDADVAKELGRSRQAVVDERRYHKLPKGHGRGQQQLSAEAVREAWARVQRGERLTSTLLAWAHHSTPTGTKGRHSARPINHLSGWLRGDLEKLDSLLGYCPISEMARLLGRSWRAVAHKLFDLGWMSSHLRYDARGLQFALAAGGRYVSVETVKDWIKRGKVRTFQDGHKNGMRIIHRDDADWLCSNYEYGMHFPRHPGADEEVKEPRAKGQGEELAA